MSALTALRSEAAPPGIHVQTKTSPEFVQTSFATAALLRLRPRRFNRDALSRCVNVLLTYPDSCQANWAECVLGRERLQSRSESPFIRVEWPVVETAEIANRLRRYSCEAGWVCLSTVTHGRALADTVAVLRVLKAAAPDLLFSGLIAPHMVGESELAALRNAGMDRIAIGLDAAFERGFEHRRGRRVLGSASWEQYWGVLRKARMMFGPFHVSCHVNVGLGESDVDVVETLFRLRHAEIAVFPVSVYSDAGTERPGSCRPGLARRQRLQLARQLIAMDVLAPDQVVYSAAGCIERFVVSPGAIEAAARVDGLGCSRLFGSYRPISQEDFSPVDAAENRAENLQSTPTPTAVKPRRAAKYGQAQREGQSGNEGRAFAEVVR